MSIDTGEVRNIAWLARLTAGEDELEQYREDLGSILGLVDEMNTADTTDITPLAHPLDLGARLRPDRIMETNQRNKFQAIAPDVEEGYYLVPRVIE